MGRIKSFALTAFMAVVCGLVPQLPLAGQGIPGGDVLSVDVAAEYAPPNPAYLRIPINPLYSTPIALNGLPTKKSAYRARWESGSVSHYAGAYSVQMSTAARVDGAFVRMSKGIKKVIGVAKQLVEIGHQLDQIKEKIEFIHKNGIQFKVDLWRFMPEFQIDFPDEEIGDPEAKNPNDPNSGKYKAKYVVGFFPKGDKGYGNRSVLYEDNPYLNGRKGTFQILEVKYPRSWSDLDVDVSIWGDSDGDMELFQQKLMAGYYHGVMSAATFIDGIGDNGDGRGGAAGSNLASNLHSISPKKMAKRRTEAMNSYIETIKARKLLLQKALKEDPEALQMVGRMTPDEMAAEIDAIDAKIAEMEEKLKYVEDNEAARQMPWKEEAAFITDVLANLETSSRLKSINKLGDKYEKYEVFWRSPDMMNPTPEITGMKAVDNIIYVLWEGATILSRGKIAAPTPASGGPSAEAQAVMVKSMYRQFLAQELEGFRRLVSHEFQNEQQMEAVKFVTDGVNAVERLREEYLAHFARNDETERMLNFKKDLEKASPEVKEIMDALWGAMMNWNYGDKQ